MAGVFCFKMGRMSAPKIFPLIFLLTLLGAGCRARGDVTPSDLFAPPTSAASPIAATPATSLPPNEAAASALPTCTNNLLFIADLTIPDGTLANPNETLDKRWRVENNGTCNWGAGYSLRLVAGSGLGAVSPAPLYPAVAGSETDIRLLFTAPQESSTYRSAWQAHDPAGNPFGDPIFIEIIVP